MTRPCHLTLPADWQVASGGRRCVATEREVRNSGRVKAEKTKRGTAQERMWSRPWRDSGEGEADEVEGEIEGG